MSPPATKHSEYCPGDMGDELHQAALEWQLDQDNSILRSFQHSILEAPILIDDMSNNTQRVPRGQGPSSPELQALETRQGQLRVATEHLATAHADAYRQWEVQQLDNYVKSKEDEMKAKSFEVLVHSLQREIEEHKRVIKILRQRLTESDAIMREKDHENKDLVARNLQQAATIKHQSQLIQNPRSSLATPSHGQENVAPVNAAYTAPAPRYNQSMQSFCNPSANRRYLNSAEQGSPAPRRVAAPPGNGGHSPNSSTGTNPYSATPKFQQTQYGGDNSRPTTSSTQATSTANNSMALMVVGDGAVTGSTVDLTKGFEHAYSMVETFARAHVNFVSSEKDGNMPQSVKQALLGAAAPANAFPFMAKPESRYHMVAKLMVVWINKEVLKGISFIGFNAHVDEIIEATKNKMFQGTPVVIKAMYMNDIANHVKGLLGAQGFKEFFQQLCRDKGNELWKLIKPMMHQKTTNDWNDMYALMHETHKLAIEMILSGKEFLFESIDIQTRFDPATMINKEQTMMGMSGGDLAHRGAVVKLGITPKVGARTYHAAGNFTSGLVYPATVLTKWAEVRQGFSAHRRT